MLVKMAFRNILRNRRRTLLTSSMIIGGYVFVSASLSIIEGSYGNIISLFTSQYTGHIQIANRSYIANPSLYQTIQKYESVLKTLKKNPHILALAPRIYGEALVYLKNKTFGAQIVGIDPLLENIATHYSNRILLGTPFNENSNDEALVGKKIAKILEIKIGDKIALLSQGADGSIANDLFQVKGIIGTEQEGKDDYRIYLPLKKASEFFVLPHQVHEISIHLTHFKKARYLSAQLKLSDPKLIARPWQRVESDFYKAMQADKRGNNISIFILMLMVTVGVFNTILMSALERTREFAVLKALGTLPKDLFLLILTEGCLLSILSAGIGFFISLGLNHYLTYYGIHLKTPIHFAGTMFSDFKGTMDLKTFIDPAVIVIFSALTASLYPGWKASKMKVAQALREF